MNEKIGKLILVGGVGDNRWGDRFRQGDSCYDIDGISPTLTAQPVGNTGGFSPLFIDMEMIRCLRLVRTEQAKQCRKQYENHEIDVPRSQLQELEIRDDDCSNTITTVLKDNLVLESSDMETVKIKCANSQGFKECEVGGVFDAAFADTDRHSRVVDNGQVSPTLTSEGQQVCKVESPIAIRKLTPRECWRLMDFTDEQFDRAAYQTKVEYLEGGDDLCCANFQVVPEKQRQKDMETYVSCTINDSQNMEILKTIKNELANKPESEKMQNVSIAIERSEEQELSDYEISITKCITFMGMQCILMEDNDRQATVIIVSVEMDNMNTEKSMKITTESNLDQNKLYIILILIKLIMQSKIFGATIPTVNISGYTQLIEDSSNNMGLKILNLKMESMCSRVSSSQLYKQAGNSIVVACLEAIFSQLGIGEEWNKRNFDSDGE